MIPHASLNNACFHNISYKEFRETIGELRMININIHEKRKELSELVHGQYLMQERDVYKVDGNGRSRRPCRRKPSTPL